MGVIQDEIFDAFRELKKTGDVFKFAEDIAHVGDAHVHYDWQWQHLKAQIEEAKKHFKIYKVKLNIKLGE